MRLLNSFWGSLVMLIALMLVLEHATNASQLLKASGSFAGGLVQDFKA